MTEEQQLSVWGCRASWGLRLAGIQCINERDCGGVLTMGMILIFGAFSSGLPEKRYSHVAAI